jgi:hypothetical protein
MMTATKCRVIRKDGKIQKVLAPNGRRSKLFDDINKYAEKNQLPFLQDSYVQNALKSGKIKNLNSEEVALAVWSKFYTPEFQEWAGEDLVKDKNGEPILVYHGSPKNFEEFVLKEGFAGEYNPIFFAESLDYAEAHAKRKAAWTNESDIYIYPSVLRGKNIVNVTQEMDNDSTTDAMDRANSTVAFGKEYGYDYNSYAVRSSDQIKSIFNIGSFSETKNFRYKYLNWNLRNRKDTWKPISTYELEWFKKKFPETPLHVFDLLKEVHQKRYIPIWGMVHDSATFVMSKAPKGTTYHEAFHILFNSVLNSVHREYLLKEAAKKYTVTQDDLDKIKALYQKEYDSGELTDADITNLALEEYLADDFADILVEKESDPLNDNQSLLKKVGRAIYDFFRALKNFIKYALNHPLTLSEHAFMSDYGVYASVQRAKKFFKRPVRFTRYKIIDGFNPLEQQEAIEATATMLDKALTAHSEATGLAKDSKSLYSALINDDWDGNIFFGSMSYSVLNQLVEHGETLPEEMSDDFDKFIDALVEFDDNDEIVGPGPLFYKVLRAMGSRGIVIVDNSIELSQMVDEEQLDQDTTEVEITEDTREAWQVKSTEISQFEKMGAILKFELNQIPVVQWTDSDKTDVEEMKGYLNFPKVYTANEVFRVLQKYTGNAPTIELFKKKLEENAKEHPALFYVKNKFLKDNPQYTGLLFTKVGQKHHQKSVSIIHSNKASKVISTNQKGLRNKLYADIVSTMRLNSDFVRDDGTYNTDAAHTFLMYLEGIREEFKSHKKAELKKGRTVSDIDKDFFLDPVNFKEMLDSIGIFVDQDVVDKLVEDKDFLVTIRERDIHLSPMLEIIIKGGDPIGFPHMKNEMFVKNDGLIGFVKHLENNVIDNDQDHHITAEGGKKYEWADTNYVFKLINILKDKELGRKHIEQFLFQDPFYKKSPLLNRLLIEYNISNSSFLRNLDIREIGDNRQVGKYQGVPYDKMSPQMLYQTIMELFHNGNNDKVAFYVLPVPSDAPTALTVRMPMTKGKNLQDAKKGLVKLAYQELERILREDKIQNSARNKNKNKFFYITTLNEKMDKVMELTSRTPEDTEATIAAKENALDKLIRIEVDRTIKKRTDIEIEHAIDLGLIELDKDGKQKFIEGLVSEQNVRQFMTTFTAFNLVIGTDLIHLTQGDPSYYNGIGDFAKRAKQSNSPGTYLDTDAMDRPDYNVRVLKSVFAKDSKFLQFVKKIIGEKAYNIFADPDEEGNVRGIDKTDGQSKIDIYRARQILKGTHEWSQDQEKMYQRLIRGGSVNKNLEQALSTFKPFYYALHNYDGQIAPMQMKDSEFIMLPYYGQKKINGVVNQNYNEVYRGMLEEMGYTFTDNPDHTEVVFDEEGRKKGKYIDKFSYDTTVKVGLHSVTELTEDGKPDLTTGETLTFYNSEYKKQQETPNHHINDRANLAVQLRKHMINNLDPQSPYDFYDREKGEYVKISSEDIVRRHNEIIINDITNDFEELRNEFTDFDKLLTLIKKEIIRRNLGDQYLEGLQLTHNEALKAIGQRTVLSLSDPLNMHRIEALLNSLFTKGVINRKVRNGVALINVSSHGFGLSTADTKNTSLYSKEPRVIYNEDGSVKEIQCLAPIYNKKLLKYADAAGNIDVDLVEKEAPELLKGFVWRVPNEDKYSSFHIKIIGFLPAEGGGNIVLPAEITGIAGLDFDIDKMFGFFYSGINKSKDFYKEEIKRLEETVKRKRKRYKRLVPEEYATRILYDSTLEELLTVRENLENEAQVLEELGMELDYDAALLEEIINDQLLLDEYRDDYNNYEDYQSGDKKLDLLWSVWQHPNTAKSFLDPGNFERLKAHNHKIINDKAKSGAYGTAIQEKARKQNIKDLNDLLDFASPAGWEEIAFRMSTGKSLVGITANTAVAHAIMQHFDLTSIYRESFNGVGYDYLSHQYEKIGDGEFSKNRISKNLAVLLAAFVDNGKDPQAAYSNINNYTANTAMYLVLKGVPLEHIQDFLSHPLIEKFTQVYLNKGANKSAEKKAMKAAAIPTGGKNSPGKESRIENVNITKAAEDRKDYLVDFVNDELVIRRADGKQVSIKEKLRMKELLRSFLVMQKRAKTVGNMALAIKQGEAGLGPTDAHTIAKLANIDDALIKKEIKGADKMFADNSWFFNTLNNILKEARNVILESTGLPDRNIGAFKYLTEMVQEFKPDSYVNANELDFLQKNFQDYVLSDWFYTMDRQEYFQFILDMPKTLENIRKDEEAAYYKPFLDRLTIDFDHITNMNYIIFTGFGGLDPLEKNRIRETWERMLQDPKFKDFSEDLIKYSYFLSGYRVTPWGFSNLQPVYYRAKYPEFSILLNKHYTAAQDIKFTGIDNISQTNYAKLVPQYTSRFLHQFIRNHFRSLSYIPMIEAGDENVARILYTNLNKQNKPTLNSEPFLVHMNSSKKILSRSGDPVSYIKYKDPKKGWYLFMLDKSTAKYSKNGAFVSANYMPVQPLGTYKKGTKEVDEIRTVTNGIARGKMITEYNIKDKSLSSAYRENLLKDRLTEYMRVKDKNLSAKKDFPKERARLRVLGATKFYTEDIIDANLIAEYDYRMLFIGTNAKGIHGAGIATVGKELGARKGKVEGVLDDNAEPKTYGVITKKDYRVERSSSMQEIIDGIKKFYDYARQNPTKEIWVPYKAKGENLNGYTPQEMAYMFAEAGVMDDNGEKIVEIPNNVIFHEQFRDLIFEYADNPLRGDVKGIFKKYKDVLASKWGVTTPEQLSMALASDKDLLQRIKTC